MILRLYSKLINRISASGLLKSIMKLVMGTGIAQAITILLSPVITRIYTTEDYGDFNFFIAIVAAFVMISALRYELAIVFAPNDREAGAVLKLSGRINLIIMIILSVFCIGINLFPGILHMNLILRRMLLIMPVMVYVSGWTNIFQNWFLRFRKLRLISFAKIWNSAGANGFILFFGLIGLGAWGLVLGTFAGYIILFVFLFWFYSRKYSDLIPPGPLEIKEPSQKYRDLPLSNTPQALLEMLQNYGIIFLSRMLFTSNIVGLYGLAMRVLQAPLWLIGSSIAQVYNNEAAAAINDKRSITRIFNSTVLISTMVAAPVLIVIGLFGPSIFGFVWGWREAGVYASILAPWMFFDFIRFSVAQTIVLAGKTRLMMFFSAGGLLLMAISMYIGSRYTGDPKGGYALLSVVMSIYAFMVILWIRRLAINSINREI